MKRSIILLVLAALIGAGISFPAAAQDKGLLIWADKTRTPALQPVADAFTKEYGVPVTVQEVDMGSIRNNLPVAGPAGEGPDIIIAAHDWIGELIQNGAVIPIDLGDKASLFTEVSLALFTYGGKLYGMPYATENLAFFRNTDLVPDAPKTWDEVKSITEQLVSSGKSKYGFIMKDSDGYDFQPLMSAFGGYVFGVSADGNYDAQDVGIDSTGTIAAGGWLQDMAKAGYLIPSVDYDVEHTMFESGDAAMLMTGPWALPRLKQSGVHYAISNIPDGPAGPGKPFIGGQGFMISAYSQNQLLAESFLMDYMAADEPMKALYDVDPRMPAFTSVLESLNDPDLNAFLEAGKTGIPMPSIPQMSSVWGAWGNAEKFVISGQQDPQAAFSDAGVAIRDLIAGKTPPVAGSSTGAGGETVNLPGTFQKQLGCGGDWDPACDKTMMKQRADDGIWQASFDLETGDYEYKAALNGTWDVNYGAGAAAGGDNIKFSLTEMKNVTFLFDPNTHWITDNVNSIIVSAPGSYQAKIGCPNDWSPDCLKSWLEDPDGDGVYSFSTTAIPAGDYEVKAAVNMTWDVNYGADGAPGGDNIKFNVPADNTNMTFSFDSKTNILTVSAGS